MKILKCLPILLSLIIISCESATEPKDCAGVPNGDSWESDCGCVDVDNSGDDCDDCAGVPNGAASEDCLGVCDGDGILNDDEVCCNNGLAGIKENNCNYLTDLAVLIDLINLNENLDGTPDDVFHNMEWDDIENQECFGRLIALDTGSGREITILPENIGSLSCLKSLLQF